MWLDQASRQLLFGLGAHCRSRLVPFLDGFGLEAQFIGHSDQPELWPYLDAHRQQRSTLHLPEPRNASSGLRAVLLAQARHSASMTCTFPAQGGGAGYVVDLRAEGWDLHRVGVVVAHGAAGTGDELILHVINAALVIRQLDLDLLHAPVAGLAHDLGAFDQAEGLEDLLPADSDDGGNVRACEPFHRGLLQIVAPPGDRAVGGFQQVGGLEPAAAYRRLAGWTWHAAQRHFTHRAP